MIILVMAVLSAYLLGSIPTSYIVSKAARGIDIRKYGSGNVGATNVLRTLGKVPAVIALIGDLLKGTISVTFLSSFFYRYAPAVNNEDLRIIMGLAAISGHIWPVFLKFRGGKGVATSAGVLMILCPKAMGVATAVWFITVALSKYVSLGSILASVSLPVTAALMGLSLRLVIFSIILCIVSCYRHKSNIKRLINREELKIGRKYTT